MYSIRQLTQAILILILIVNSPLILAYLTQAIIILIFSLSSIMLRWYYY